MHPRHKHFITITVTATALALGLVGSSGWAHADRFDISMGSLYRVMHSSSVDAVSEGDMSLFSLTGAVAIDSVNVPFFDRFYVEGVFEAGGTGANTFQTLDTSTSMLSWALGARLSRDLSDRVTVQGRANLGISRVGVTISDMFMDGPSLGDSGYTGTAYVGAVSDFMLTRRQRAGANRFSFGLRAEVGYLAALPKSLRAQPDDSDREEGAILIPESAASLGSLNLSALSMRVGLVGRF